MPCPEEITPEHIDALATMLDMPKRHTERCVEQLSYLASEGQSWKRTLQIRIPGAPTSSSQKRTRIPNILPRRRGYARAANSRWYPVSLGAYKRRRLPDFEVRDCNGVRLNLLTRQQHGEVLARAALSNYLQLDRPGLTLDEISPRARNAYIELVDATRDLFTSAQAGGAAQPLARVVVELLNLSEIMGEKPHGLEDAEKWREQRTAEFFDWASEFAKITQYLCWVRARPGDVVNLSVSYTTADAREELESGIWWRDAFVAAHPSMRRDARMALYQAFGLAPLHSIFTVPGKERGASYYFTLKPPENTVVTYLDWQDGNNLDAGRARSARKAAKRSSSSASSLLASDPGNDDQLDCADHAVHFHSSGESSAEPKTIRAYLRSVPRAQTQIAAGALLNVVFMYLVARGRVHDTSTAQWLLLTPAVLLAYLAEQQRHYYAIATRAQRAVLWVYLGITIGTLVTVLFGEPQSSERWGWLATGFAWLLVGSSLALFGLMAPLGYLHQRITDFLAERSEQKQKEIAKAEAAARRAYRSAPAWEHYERIALHYADAVLLFASALTIVGVLLLALTNWGRTLPPALGGLEQTAEASDAASHERFQVRIGASLELTFVPRSP